RQELMGVGLGTGDAAALSFAFAQATPTRSPTSAPPPSTAAPAPAGEPATAPSARLQDGHPAEERSVTLRGSVYGLAGANLFLKSDDGRVVVVDMSKLDPSTARRPRLGSHVTVVAVPLRNKFPPPGLVEDGPQPGDTRQPAR